MSPYGRSWLGLCVVHPGLWCKMVRLFAAPQLSGDASPRLCSLWGPESRPSCRGYLGAGA
jgi:hypothetical protein